MLSKSMIDKLNQQLNLEFYSSNMYLQMSAWCEDKSYNGSAAFLRDHAREEMTHMQRLFDYLSETGVLPLIGAIDAPPSKFSSLAEVFKKTYEHEQLITKKINELVHEAMTTQDYSTFNFLQWYVSEQHEEEKLFKSIVDKLEMATKDGNTLSLLFVDKELRTMVGAAS